MCFDLLFLFNIGKISVARFWSLFKIFTQDFLYFRCFEIFKLTFLTSSTKLLLFLSCCHITFYFSFISDFLKFRNYDIFDLSKINYLLYYLFYFELLTSHIYICFVWSKTSKHHTMEINGDVTMETNKRIKSENRASQPFDTRT